MRWLSTHWQRPRGGPELGAVAGRFVAVDLETTGLDPRSDAIVAVAAIPFVAGVPQAGLVTLVQPGRSIPPASTAIHGITDDMVTSAPPVPRVLRAMQEACGHDVLVGHGVTFDLAVIARERKAHGLGPLRNRALDTMRLVSALHRDWTDVGLDAVATRLGITVNGRHTADGDALAAGHVLLAILPDLVLHGLRTVPELLWFQDTATP